MKTRNNTHVHALSPINRALATSLVLSTSLLLVACGDDDDASDDTMADDGGDGDAAVNDDLLTLRVTLSGLEPLAGGFEYEGWFVGDDGPVSAGRFNLKDGETTAEVEVSHAAAEGAMMYVLTIEPPLAEDDPGASDTHILAGAWDNYSASLSVDADAAFGDDFTAATGEFFLETPTTTEADDFSQGIWFITPGDPMTAGLSLPMLPEGWIYEGWVAGPDGPISTGKFVDPAGVDDDGAGPDAGTEGAPPFPGQDFIDPALDLLGADFVAVISVEPVPDDSPAPFAFKPLVGMVADEDAGVGQMMENMASAAPSGTVEMVTK